MGNFIKISVNGKIALVQTDYIESIVESRYAAAGQEGSCTIKMTSGEIIHVDDTIDTVVSKLLEAVRR